MNKLIVANLKSNKSFVSINNWLNNFLSGVNAETFEKVEVAVAPPFIALPSVSENIFKSGKKLSLSTQDISSFPAGSYTGAISGQNLSGLDIKYAIVGHSERRKYFRETSSDVALKVEQSLQNDITPILCIDVPYMQEQLNLINDKNLSKCVIAYEPNDSIGSGNNIDVGEVNEMNKNIRKIAGDVKIIYGGSVNERNINEYLMVTDGVIIGTAALNSNTFMKVIKTSLVDEKI